MAHSASAQGTNFKVLYKFAGVDPFVTLFGDGSVPEGDLIRVGDILYGTTLVGGRYTGNCYYVSCGTVYSFNLVTGVEKVIYGFSVGASSPNGGLNHIDGKLYGTIEGGIPFTIKPPIFVPGYVFSVDPGTSAVNFVHTFLGQNDGHYPASGMIESAGLLYGTTASDGAAGYGTVFVFNPKTGAEKVLYFFQGGADGAAPANTLLMANGLLYGTTGSGGDSQCGCGTVFALNPETGAEKVLHRFQGGSDGKAPSGRLHLIDVMLYGTTVYGGTGDPANCSGCGTIFAVNAMTGAETIVHSFGGGLDGAYPTTGLTERRSKLYGLTNEGGVAGCSPSSCGYGTIFSLDPTSGTEKVVYAFTGTADGAYPAGALLNVGGTLYGTTRDGGEDSTLHEECVISGCGTLFAVTP